VTSPAARGSSWGKVPVWLTPDRYVAICQNTLYHFNLSNATTKVMVLRARRTRDVGVAERQSWHRALKQAHFPSFRRPFATKNVRLAIVAWELLNLSSPGNLGCCAPRRDCALIVAGSRPSETSRLSLVDLTCS
jgi:hypothetical protein